MIESRENNAYPVVRFEVMGQDADSLRQFYSELLVWMTFYSQVPDLNAALARARGLGSRVLLPPVRQGDTTIAVVSDPEGHPVGLCSASV